MKKIFVLGFLAAVLGVGALFAFLKLIPGDEVTQTYESYAAAKSDRLFERGWLPIIIPESATKITTTNDLDLNIADGEFYFEPADAAAFTAKLSPAEAGSLDHWTNLEATGYTLHTFTEDNSTWHFAVHPHKGHARFELAAR